MVGALANCLRTGKWRSVPLLVAPSPARGHRPRKGLADAGHVPAKDWSFTPPPRYQDALQEWASGEFDALRIGLDKVMADGGGSRLDVVGRAQGSVQEAFVAAQHRAAFATALKQGYKKNPSAPVDPRIEDYRSVPQHADYLLVQGFVGRLMEVALRELEEADAKCSAVEEQAVRYLYEPMPKGEDGAGGGEGEVEMLFADGTREHISPLGLRA